MWSAHGHTTIVLFCWQLYLFLLLLLLVQPQYQTPVRIFISHRFNGWENVTHKLFLSFKGTWVPEIIPTE